MRDQLDPDHWCNGGEYGSSHPDALAMEALDDENKQLRAEVERLKKRAKEAERLKKRAKEAERLLKLAKQNHLANHTFMADEYGYEPIEKDNFTDAIDLYLKEVQG